MPRPPKNADSSAPRGPQVPAPRNVRVRDLRANLKALLADGAPLIVGNTWHPKALVLPCHWPHDGAWPSQEARRARLRALFAAALEVL